MIRALALAVGRLWLWMAGPALCPECGTERSCDECIGGGLWE